MFLSQQNAMRNLQTSYGESLKTNNEIKIYQKIKFLKCVYPNEMSYKSYKQSNVRNLWRRNSETT